MKNFIVIIREIFNVIEELENKRVYCKIQKFIVLFIGFKINIEFFFIFINGEEQYKEILLLF